CVLGRLLLAAAAILVVAQVVNERDRRVWALAVGWHGSCISSPRRHSGCADGKEEPDALDDHRRPARPLAACPDRRYRGGFHSPAARACPDRAGLPIAEWTERCLTQLQPHD